MTLENTFGQADFRRTDSNGSVISVAEKTLNELRNIPGIAVPKNKVELRVLKNYLNAVTVTQPLDIYVGSCPDYSHMNGLYTHLSLGGDVSLLTSQHLKFDTGLLRLLDERAVPYRFIVMIADVEATDEVFAGKFTGGDVGEFLRRCEESRKKTAAELDQLKVREGLKGELVSSSFFREFTQSKFMELQVAYTSLLSQNYTENPNLRTRIDGDTAARMGMYTRMYDGITDNLSMIDKQAFYVSRTIRTMAQYLSLGRLITEKSKFPVVINHPTRNIGVYNDRNKYLLPSDGSSPQPTIPIFEMTTKVY